MTEQSLLPKADPSQRLPPLLRRPPSGGGPLCSAFHPTFLLQTLSPGGLTCSWLFHDYFLWMAPKLTSLTSAAPLRCPVAQRPSLTRVLQAHQTWQVRTEFKCSPVLYEFPRAVITNHHELGGRKQQKFSLSVLEAVCLESRCWQCWGPSEGSGERCFLPLPASSGPRYSWVYSCIMPSSASVLY